MAHKPARFETFADVLNNLPTNPGVRVSTSSRDALRASLDAEGTGWRQRGGPVEGKALHRLLVDPAIRVLHEYWDESREIPPEDREQFWVTLLETMDANPHADFCAVEFKNDSRERLLLVVEIC